MTTLTREAILNASDIGRELVTVPEWGGDVYVSVMSGTDRDSWECKIQETVKSQRDIRALLLVRTITDEAGTRLFSDEDLSALGSKNWKSLDRCYDVAVRLNKLSDRDLEDLEKNSGARGVDSSSTSAGT